ncbi:hypothetical protein AGDE_09910 [Angomonas deanei]|uniref:Ubiquitin-like domain-containing protein n=1 Tax=Angomonas deanei TaxID=59799 RepID=A0A7G2CE44_9TRYP|nr:hypothetical protein AGDE_09910 [Angomonas deanei]CAD2218120.1 hypothetical protein, conserved [Angomonas deanei]|eukprot:EPY29701.1 hypothetical protein AGDE_09910 [Angomonas deanei]
MPPAATPSSDTHKVLVSIQCSEGRFEQDVSSDLTIKEVKKLFKKSVPQLWDVNTNGYVLYLDGVYLTDESLRLKDLKLVDSEEKPTKGATPPTFIFIKRSACLFMNKTDEKEEN